MGKIQEIVFSSFSGANDVIHEMENIIERAGYVTVADYYELTKTLKYAPESLDFGWYDISGAIIRFSDKLEHSFVIKFPDPVDLTVMPLDEKELASKNSVSDPVNHPQHYMSETGLETIDVIEAFTADLKGIEAVCTANVIKYICRWNHKNGVEDLKKARWYLERLINHVDISEKENE